MSAARGNPLDGRRRALAHPTRRHILAALRACREPVSPRSLVQRELVGESMANLSYHFRVLKGCGKPTAELVDNATLSRIAGILEEKGVVPQAALPTTLRVAGGTVADPGGRADA